MKLLKWAILATPLAILPSAFSTPATARAAVAINFGDVALGYQDGYYDKSHHYHQWASQDAVRYRTQYHDNYRDMAHSRDHDRSWDH